MEWQASRWPTILLGKQCFLFRIPRCLFPRFYWLFQVSHHQVLGHCDCPMGNRLNLPWRRLKLCESDGLGSHVTRDTVKRPQLGVCNPFRIILVLIRLCDAQQNLIACDIGTERAFAPSHVILCIRVDAASRKTRTSRLQVSFIENPYRLTRLVVYSPKTHKRGLLGIHTIAKRLTRRAAGARHDCHGCLWAQSPRH